MLAQASFLHLKPQSLAADEYTNAYQQLIYEIRRLAFQAGHQNPLDLRD
jgi:hypothetical protein